MCDQLRVDIRHSSSYGSCTGSPPPPGPATLQETGAVRDLTLCVSADLLSFPMSASGLVDSDFLNRIVLFLTTTPIKQSLEDTMMSNRPSHRGVKFHSQVLTPMPEMYIASWYGRLRTNGTCGGSHQPSR